MNKFLKALVVGLSLIVSLNSNALEIQQNEIDQKSFLVCKSGLVESSDFNNCVVGFKSMDVKEFAALQGYHVEGYEVQVSNGLVYIIMKVSK